MSSAALWTSHEDRYLLDRCPSRDTAPWLDDAWFRERGIGDGPFNAANAILGEDRDDDRLSRTALISGSGEWTYAELGERTRRLTACLQRELGLRPGGGVVLQLANGPWMVAALLAILRAGGVAILCSHLLTSDEVSQIVARTRARIWIGGLVDAPSPTGSARYVGLDTLVARAGQFSLSDGDDFVATAPTDPAVILFSSGSTGVPKPCVHFHRELIVVSETYGQDVVPIGPGDIALSSASFSFAYGLESSVLMPLYRGATSIALDASGPLELLRAIQDHQVTHLYSIPAMYRGMVRISSQFDLGSLRYCVSAGEGVSAELVGSWRDACGQTIIDGLGSSEFNSFIISARPGEIVDGATGRLVPGFQSMVVGDDLAEVGPGEIGRLMVRGPTGCKYFDSPAEQQAQVVSGWTLTGDRVSQDADGLFWHQGRSDSIINRGGLKISANEIERVLGEHPDVAECVVAGVFDAKYQTNLIKAFIALKGEAAAVSNATATFRPWLLQRLAPHKIPDSITCVAAIPRNANGKVNRARLLSEG